MGKRRAEDGRIIKTWTAKANGQEFPCHVRMAERPQPYSAKTDTVFFVTCPALGLRVDEDEDKGDPNTADKKPKLTIDQMVERVEKKVAAATSITWRPYLYVQTQGRLRPLPDKLAGHGHGTEVAEVTVKVDCVQLAETPQGKRHRWREVGGRYDAADAQGEKGWPATGVAPESKESWRRKYENGDDRPLRALVPDTPENRLALEEVVAGFGRLRATLQQFLAPEKIHATLAAVAAGGGPLALPPAPPAGPKKPGKGRSS